jgi:hypothetical protein
MDVCSVYIAVYGLRIFTLLIKVLVVEATIRSILTSLGFCESTELSIHSIVRMHSILYVSFYYA